MPEPRSGHSGSRAQPAAGSRPLASPRVTLRGEPCILHVQLQRGSLRFHPPQPRPRSSPQAGGLAGRPRPAPSPPTASRSGRPAHEPWRAVWPGRLPAPNSSLAPRGAEGPTRGPHLPSAAHGRWPRPTSSLAVWPRPRQAPRSPRTERSPSLGPGAARSPPAASSVPRARRGRHCLGAPGIWGGLIASALSLEVPDARPGAPGAARRGLPRACVSAVRGVHAPFAGPGGPER